MGRLTAEAEAFARAQIGDDRGSLNKFYGDKLFAEIDALRAERDAAKAAADALAGVVESLTGDGAVAAETERCATVAESWADHYPEDVFPPIGTTGQPATIDQIAAQANRHAAKQIAHKIREGVEPPEQECGA